MSSLSFINRYKGLVSMSYNKEARIVTPEESECKTFFDDVKTEWEKDPTSVAFSFKTNMTKEKAIDPAEWNVQKRRQRTKNGTEDPKSPCDDKGLPLFKTPSGELVTKAGGNDVAWGSWVDAMNDGVSTSPINQTKGHCWAQRLYIRAPWHGSITEEMIAKALEEDKTHHDLQQSGKASKVAVDYKHDLVKPESSHDEWHCEITKEKGKGYPDSWKDTKFNPWISEGLYPIRIAFAIHKTGKKGQPLKSTTGVGNFRNKDGVTKYLHNGTVYGYRAFMKSAGDSGFKNEKFGNDYDGTLSIRVPGSDDACTYSMSSIDIPYYTNAIDGARLRSEEGRLYIGGAFIRAQPKISRLKGTVWPEKHDYDEKAPTKSVDFCHEKFAEVARNSIVKLVELPKA